MPSSPSSNSPLPPPHFLIIGGGIAGVTCAETLHVLRPDSKIDLISATTLVKSVSNVRQVGKLLQDFTVEEKSGTELERLCPNVRVHQGRASRLNADDRTVTLADGRVFGFDKLCVCTGATPKLVVDKDHNDGIEPFVVGIRDVESVVSFQTKLASARRVAVVGNGGISLELVYEISDCQVVWAIRHDAIGNTFFDAGAAQFLMPRLFEKTTSNSAPCSSEMASTSDEASQSSTTTRLKMRPHFESEMVNGVAVFTKNPRVGGGLEAMEEAMQRVRDGEKIAPEGVVGSALGPDWKETLTMKGALGKTGEGASSSGNSGASQDNTKSNVLLEFRVEVQEILTAEEFRSRQDLGAPLEFPSNDKTSHDSSSSWPVYLVLSNGHVWGVDLVVSATGVEPTPLPVFDASNGGAALTTSGADGGILVDYNMRTSISGVFAAGDAATANWKPAPNWFQMRLWSQARQMGGAAAKAMVAEMEGQIEYLPQDFCFECFAHVTKFFDYKCVLIGRYNGQGLDQEEDDYHVILRTTPGVEYIKLVVANNRIQGAVLIGETDLEETFENLILNQFDISQFGESILDPDVDIEDYFD